MYSNRFAVLSDESNKKHRKRKKHPPAAGESSSSASQHTPATQHPVRFIEVAPLPVQVKRVRPPLKIVQKEKPVVGDIENPNDLAHQRTRARMAFLMSQAKILNEFIGKNPEETLVNALHLEYLLISITEVLGRLRENFRCWHYNKLVHESEVNNTPLVWPKIIRNRIVHEYVNEDPLQAFDDYVKIAKQLASLHDYESRSKRQPLCLDAFIDKTKNYSEKDTHELEYTDEVQATLETLFGHIVEYEGISRRVQLMSMTRAAELIRQLATKDPDIIASGKIKIHRQPLDPEIVPYMMVIRTTIYHNLPDFPNDHADEVLEYAKGLTSSVSHKNTVMK